MEDVWISGIMGMFVGALICGLLIVGLSDTTNDPVGNSLRKVHCVSMGGEVLFDGYTWGKPQISSHSWVLSDPLTERSIYVTGECSAIPMDIENINDIDLEYRQKLLESRLDGE